jgi:hypothetical protein
MDSGRTTEPAPAEYLTMADIQNIWGAFGAKLPLILPTLVALLVVLLVQNVWSRRPLANIPVVGEELGGDQKRRQAYLSRAADLYLEGYKKVRGWRLSRLVLRCLGSMPLMRAPAAQFKDSVFRIVTPNSKPRPITDDRIWSYSALTGPARIHRRCGASQVPSRAQEASG